MPFALLVQSETTNPGQGPFGTGFMLLVLAWSVLMIVANWKMFEKAGQPGWAVLIPIYNVYVLLKIVGRPGWWLLLYLIPVVNFIIAIIVAIDLAKSFGKSAIFGFFLNFLFVGIGCLILGFGDARYQGGAAFAASR